MQMWRWVAVAWLAAVAPLAHGFSSGAPDTTCEAMVPKHGKNAAQNGPAVYTMSTSHPHTHEGKVRVMISGAEGTAPGFKGFLIQAREPGSPEALGTFTQIPEEAQLVNCGSGQGNGVTHRSNLIKQALELEWEAPADWEGNVNFVATLVSNYSTYWVGLPSDLVRVDRHERSQEGASGISTTKAPATVTVEDVAASEMELYAGCGRTKSCVGRPIGCLQTKDCDAAVSVTARGKRYIIDMIGKRVKYVAVGFSDDTKMGGDNVVECVHDDSDPDNGINAYRSWNIPGVKRNRREEKQSGFSLERGAYIDGVVYCRLSHDAVVTLQEKTFNLDKLRYYLLVAAGTELNKNNLGYHTIFGSSADKQLMADYRVVATPDTFYDGCNDLKTCFGAPGNCVESRDCQAVVAVLTQGMRYQFELKAKASGYIAVGLSDDRFMGSDSVIECVNEPSSVSGPVKAYMSWNVPTPDKYNVRKPVNQDGITMLNGSYVDGSIYCKVTRDVVTRVQGKVFNLAEDKYYLLLAAGSSVKADSVGYHDVIFVSSGQQAALTDVGGFTEASKTLLRLHGAFMVAAWLGVASLGIVLARYYRQTWVTSSACGKDVWFAWHRFLMLLVWLLTLAGAVIIVVEVGGWVSGAATAHALLGSVTTLLCFVQPFMALFRPHPGASKRALFNWIHWLVGNAAHIIAIVTIFLAVQLNKAELPQWMDWVLVGFVAFYVVVHLMLSMCGCMSDRSGSKRINTFPMKDMNSARAPLSMERKQDAPHAGFRKCLLFIFILGLVVLTTFLVLVVVFAPFERNWEQFQESVLSM